MFCNRTKHATPSKFRGNTRCDLIICQHKNMKTLSSTTNMSNKAHKSALKLPQKNRSKKSSTYVQAHNQYNIFFILEHKLILQSRGVFPYDAYSSTKHSQFKPDVHSRRNNEYMVDLAIPPLPSRYSSLILPDDWFVPGRKKLEKRKHTKTHGVISFKDVAHFTATNWKNIDQETLDFVTQVADITKRRFSELECTRKEIQSSSSDCAPDSNKRNHAPVDDFCQSCMLQQLHQPPLSPTHSSSEVDIPDEMIISMWLSMVI